MKMTRRIATDGLLTAVCFMLSYVETLLPSAGLPGVKMGLANICVLFALYRLTTWDAVVISGVRIILNWIIFGNISGAIYSVFGAILSLGAMYMLKKSGKFSTIGVSLAGGAVHNFGQVLAAVIMLGPGALGYLPPLLILGEATGAVNGIVAGVILGRVKGWGNSV